MPGAVSCSFSSSEPLYLSSDAAGPDKRGAPCWPDFPHEHARSRTYRWGEDGIAGVCDTHGFQNIAFAFWNGKEYVNSH